MDSTHTCSANFCYYYTVPKGSNLNNSCTQNLNITKTISAKLIQVETHHYSTLYATGITSFHDGYCSMAQTQTSAVLVGTLPSI